MYGSRVNLSELLQNQLSINPVAKQQSTFSTQLLKSPVVVILSMVLGICAGLYFPDFSKSLASVGETYFKLLQMTIIPILMSALFNLALHLTFLQSRPTSESAH